MEISAPIALKQPSTRNLRMLGSNVPGLAGGLQQPRRRVSEDVEGSSCFDGHAEGGGGSCFDDDDAEAVPERSSRSHPQSGRISIGPKPLNTLVPPRRLYQLRGRAVQEAAPAPKPVAPTAPSRFSFLKAAPNISSNKGIPLCLPSPLSGAPPLIQKPSSPVPFLPKPPNPSSSPHASADSDNLIHVLPPEKFCGINGCTKPDLHRGMCAPPMLQRRTRCSSTSRPVPREPDPILESLLSKINSATGHQAADTVHDSAGGADSCNDGNGEDAGVANAQSGNTFEGDFGEGDIGEGDFGEEESDTHSVPQSSSHGADAVPSSKAAHNTYQTYMKKEYSGVAVRLAMGPQWTIKGQWALLGFKGDSLFPGRRGMPVGARLRQVMTNDPRIEQAPPLDQRAPGWIPIDRQSIKDEDTVESHSIGGRMCYAVYTKVLSCLQSDAIRQHKGTVLKEIDHPCSPFISFPERLSRPTTQVVDTVQCVSSPSQIS